MSSTNIEELVERFCDNYCRYPLTCADQEELQSVCDGCPMNQIGEMLEGKDGETNA